MSRMWEVIFPPRAWLAHVAQLWRVGESTQRTTLGAHSAGTIAPVVVESCDTHSHTATCDTSHKLRAARRVLYHPLSKLPMGRSGTRGQAPTHPLCAARRYYSIHQASAHVAHGACVSRRPRSRVCAHLNGYCSTCRDARNVQITCHLIMHLHDY